MSDPQLNFPELFSAAGAARDLLLFLSVMHAGLFTGSGDTGLGGVLSGPLFSRVDDCANLVKSLQGIVHQGEMLGVGMASIPVPF